MLHEIQSSHRPLVITQNDNAAAVLISPPDFDLLTEQAVSLTPYKGDWQMFKMDG